MKLAWVLIIVVFSTFAGASQPTFAGGWLPGSCWLGPQQAARETRTSVRDWKEANPGDIGITPYFGVVHTGSRAISVTIPENMMLLVEDDPYKGLLLVAHESYYGVNFGLACIPLPRGFRYVSKPPRFAKGCASTAEEVVRIMGGQAKYWKYSKLRKTWTYIKHLHKGFKVPEQNFVLLGEEGAYIYYIPGMQAPPGDYYGLVLVCTRPIFGLPQAALDSPKR